MVIKACCGGLVALLITGVLAAGLMAEGTVEKAGISIVEVPVFVTDRDGNPVVGLAEKDFEVHEDGKRQDIEVFMPISMEGPVETRQEPVYKSQTQKAELPRYELRRHIFMVFDFIFGSLAGVNRMFEGASFFIDKEMRDQDLVSLWVISGRDGLQLFSNFTNDRPYLKSCIQRIRQGAGLPSETYATGVADLIGPAGLRGLASRTPDENPELQPDTAVVVQAEERSLRESWLDELERLARMISKMPGRKFCLLFSTGFGVTGITGTASIPTDSTTASSNMVARLLEASQLQPRILDQLDRITHAFSTADCQVFTFDTTGLYSEPNLGAMDHPTDRGRLFPDSLGSIDMLAYQTGGECYMNMNDLRGPVSKFMKKTSHYYLLGYRTPARTSERDRKEYHDIDVRLPRHRLQIRHRPGYSESVESPVSEPEQALIELAATALYDLPANGITFTPAAFTAPASDEQAAMAVAFEIPGSQFEGWKGDLPLEFYVFALDNREQVITYTRGEHLVSEHDLIDRVTRAGIRYSHLMLLPAGRELNLRFVVRNARDGRFGTVTVKCTSASQRTSLFITAPIFPAGSPTGDDMTASWVNLQGVDQTKPPRGLGNGPVDLLLVWDGKQFSPDLSPFDDAVRRTVLVKVYANRPQVHAEDVTLECEVLDASGAVVARPELPNAAPAQATNGHVDYLLWIDPRDFPPSAATLRITAVDSVTGAKARSQVAVGGLTAAAGAVQQ